MQAYDLFRHNCNNFTDSFANFLVGKGIPHHITDMPKAVLDSPLGRMLMPQLMQGVNADRSTGSILGLEQSAQPPLAYQPPATPPHKVQLASRPEELSRLLEDAKRSSAVLFLTSATCPPCKALYPVYDELAEELGDKVTLIKVDISQPQNAAIAERFQARATPTFITFLKGQQDEQWTGAEPVTLRSKIRLLSQMAHPLHPHEMLRLPTFSNPDSKPVLYSKIPPLIKLAAKMGDDLAGKPAVKSLARFIEDRAGSGPQEAVVPDLCEVSALMREALSHLPPEEVFALVDLLRCALVDPRISAHFAEEEGQSTVRGILEYVNQQPKCPYPLRLVTLQMGCNLFSTPLFADEVLGNTELRKLVIDLTSSSFLDDHHSNIRVAAASLLFNLALADRRSRRRDPEAGLTDEDQIEVAASVVEAVTQEESSKEALEGMLSALGHLIFGRAPDGELADLLRTLDAQGMIRGKRKQFPDEKLIAEVADEMLGNGFARR